MANDDSSKEAGRHHRDLLDHAQTTKDDLYALLSLPSPFSASEDATTSATTIDAANSVTESQIKAAWRRTALRLHPDKNRGDEARATEQYNAASLANEILKDPELRATYDSRLGRERETRRRTEQFDARRKAMKADLERRETAGASPVTVNGVKRARNGEEETTEERREREIRRLAAEGQRRRLEREEAAKRRRQEETREAERLAEDCQEDIHASDQTNTATVPELDRTVKVRWPAPVTEHNINTDFTEEGLRTQFARFGNVDSVVMLKDKKARPSVGHSPLISPTENIKTKHSKKQLMRTAIIVFSSVVGAHAAVTDFTKLVAKGVAGLKNLDSVNWASGSAPYLGFIDRNKTGEKTRNSDIPTENDPFAVPKPKSQTPVENGDLSDGYLQARAPFTQPGEASSVKKSTPSFTFTPKAHGSPLTNGSNGINGTEYKASPSLYEVTMMRLKEAERRKLEESIRKAEAEQGD